MSKEEIKYEAAFAELQSIVTKMENDELDIDPQFTKGVRFILNLHS